MLSYTLVIKLINFVSKTINHISHNGLMDYIIFMYMCWTFLYARKTAGSCMLYTTVRVDP